MDAPFSNSIERDVLTTSMGACDAHKILFEAELHGLVTTEPTAGSLPIKDVTVEWELLSSDHSSALKCNGCSGKIKTTDSGAFHLTFKVDDDNLKNLKNFDDTPIRLKYYKSTFVIDENGKQKEIKHKFLCNEGVDPCNAKSGDVEFIGHLDFAKRIHIYDDTSVPFSGRITHYGTKSKDTPDGCPIVAADVCLMHYVTRDVLNSLVCVTTDANGEYAAPVILGGK